MVTPALPWDLIAILILLGIVVPWRGVIRVRALLASPDVASADRIAIYASTIALQWVVASLTVWRCIQSGWTLRSLGISLPDPIGAITLGLGIALFFALIQRSSHRRLSRIVPEQRGRVYELAHKLMPQDATEALAFLALVCTVSLCEEFLYRGFIFAVFHNLFNQSSAAAVIGSSLLFAVAHLYQGRGGIASTFVIGTIFALARLFTGSLVPGIIGHFVIDLVAGLAAPGAIYGASDDRSVSGL